MPGEDKGGDKGGDEAPEKEIDSDGEVVDPEEYHRDREAFLQRRDLERANPHFRAVQRIQDSFETHGFLTHREHFQLKNLIDPRRTMGVTEVGTQAAQNLMYQSQDLVGASLHDAMFGQAGHAYQTSRRGSSSGARGQPRVPVNTLNQPRAQATTVPQASSSSRRGSAPDPKEEEYDPKDPTHKGKGKKRPRRE